MENIKLGDLYLSRKESTNIIEFLAKMRNIKNYKSKSSNKLYEIFKKQSKNQRRIDNVREDLKDLSYKLSKSELKNIKTNLCNTEKTKKISSNKTSKYLDELDKKILKLDETCVMYTRSDNEEFMSSDDTNEIIKLLFESFLQRFEENLQNKMRGSEFEFDGINFFLL